MTAGKSVYGELLLSIIFLMQMEGAMERYLSKTSTCNFSLGQLLLSTFGLLVVHLVIDNTVALILSLLFDPSWMGGRCKWLNELDFFHHFQNRKVLCNNDQLLLPTPTPSSLLPPIDKKWTSFFFFPKSAAASWFTNVYVTLDCTLAYLVNLVLSMAGPKASIA